MDIEQEQPAAQDSTPETPAESAEGLDLESELPEGQQNDGEIEDELEGVKLKGKKDEVERIKAERLMQADYTRKTQSVADERRSLEQQRQDIFAQAQIQQAIVEDISSVRSIDRELEKFNGVNWGALIEQDPDTARKLELQLNNLQRQRAQAVQSLSAKQQQATQQHQATLARQKEQAAGYLAREIKGWSDERSNQLAQYAIKGGVPAEALPNVIAHMPAFGVFLHKVELYDRIVQKQAQLRPKPEAQPSPVTAITAQKAAANRDPDKMSTSEWLKWRNSTLKRK